MGKKSSRGAFRVGAVAAALAVCGLAATAYAEPVRTPGSLASEDATHPNLFSMAGFVLTSTEGLPDLFAGGTLEVVPDGAVETLTLSWDITGHGITTQAQAERQWRLYGGFSAAPGVMFDTITLIDGAFTASAPVGGPVGLIGAPLKFIPGSFAVAPGFSFSSFTRVAFSFSFPVPGSDLFIDAILSPSPEPGTMALFCLGAFGLGGFVVRRRRRRRRKSA